jgi:hypothetical protein
MKEGNNIDQLFKKGMEDPEIPFDELDWQKMAKKLDASEARRRTPLWIYAGTAIAAALLVVLFLFLSEQNQAPDKKANTTVRTKTKPGILNETQPASDLIRPLGINKNSKHTSSEPTTTQSAAFVTSGRASGSQMSTASEIPMLKGVLPPPRLFDTWQGNEQQQIVLALPQTHNTKTTPLPAAIALESKRKQAVLEQSATRGKLTLTILAAPDVTDSKTSIGTKISSNFGLLLTYPVNKKLSISTGAIYARKLYDYGGNAATLYGQAESPWALNADCFVIDVPVNVNYQVLQKKNYSVTLNSGLSSYFMLKEKYKYTSTDQTGIPQISRLEINNQNQHLLGVANFSVSVERIVSDRVSIGVQPFLKLPLTGIGYYDYNLRSRGVAVSLSIKPFGSKN